MSLGMRVHAALVLLVLVAFAPARAAAEDVILLKNGREARGRIVDETDDGVTLDLGIGKMHYPRATIAEVKRDVAAAKVEEAETLVATAQDAREETSLLFEDGRRAGTRVLRVAKSPEGFRFEEEVVLLDTQGAPAG